MKQKAQDVMLNENSCHSMMMVRNNAQTARQTPNLNAYANMYNYSLRFVHQLLNSAKIYGTMTTIAVHIKLKPRQRRVKGSKTRGYLLASIHIAYSATEKK